ncbi:MAG: hypothetical protein IKW96_11755 [Ruminococcus sp.]|uniref:hypothetical protein n=1 Tax=Ruminococcus sp. TaxID=41978 RepID=UPI0025E78194|nr:hypothetical protein [Ruminococcus sp.]MBR5683928.1 hypothetical protein [Ruminococcus sp.]
MLTHEFGIMQEYPRKKSYNEYTPEKYGCIPVNDNFILPICPKLKELRCYWHSPDRPEFGLAYYGVTLIPPDSLEAFIEITLGYPQLSELTALLSEAQRENKFVIHFGV